MGPKYREGVRVYSHFAVLSISESHAEAPLLGFWGERRVRDIVRPHKVDSNIRGILLELWKRNCI